MKKFIQLLKDCNITVSKNKVKFEENSKMVPAAVLQELALKDILEEKSQFYRNSIKKGVKFHIYVEYPEKETEFNLNDQLNDYLEDLSLTF